MCTACRNSTQLTGLDIGWRCRLPKRRSCGVVTFYLYQVLLIMTDKLPGRVRTHAATKMKVGKLRPAGRYRPGTDVWCSASRKASLWRQFALTSLSSFIRSSVLSRSAVGATRDYRSVAPNLNRIFPLRFDCKGCSNACLNWPARDVRFICVSTGGRILGLGDIGANGAAEPDDGPHQ
jgi:Malic enzyme, N-terminal domain